MFRFCRTTLYIPSVLLHFQLCWFLYPRLGVGVGCDEGTSRCKNCFSIFNYPVQLWTLYIKGYSIVIQHSIRSHARRSASSATGIGVHYLRPCTERTSWRKNSPRMNYAARSVCELFARQPYLESFRTAYTRSRSFYTFPKRNSTFVTSVSSPRERECRDSFRPYFGTLLLSKWRLTKNSNTRRKRSIRYFRDYLTCVIWII